MILILFGPPGAGKGTQALNLVRDFNLYKISTGDLLRDEVKKKTNLGEEIKLLIDQGKFVSDKIINNLVKQIVSNRKINSRLIFDGYPRNLEQAKELEIYLQENNQKISCVFSLEVEEKLIIKRILGRQTCSKCGRIFNKYFSPSTKENHECDSKFLIVRSDDNEKTITNRFNTYNKETLPILSFYKNQKLLHQVNGMAKIDEIYKEIRNIIDPIHT